MEYLSSPTLNLSSTVVSSNHKDGKLTTSDGTVRSVKPVLKFMSTFKEVELIKCKRDWFTDKSHTRKRDYKCPEDGCGKRFILPSHLNRHILTHTGKKPHQCTQCGMSFSLPQYLKEHALTHTGEKPFKCESCDKAFSQRSNLKSHILTHTGERPFKCESCDKAFVQQSHLKRHIKTHTEKSASS